MQISILMRASVFLSLLFLRFNIAQLLSDMIHSLTTKYNSGPWMYLNEQPAGAIETIHLGDSASFHGATTSLSVAVGNLHAPPPVDLVA